MGLKTVYIEKPGEILILSKGIEVGSAKFNLETGEFKLSISDEIKGYRRDLITIDLVDYVLGEMKDNKVKRAWIKSNYPIGNLVSFFGFRRTKHRDEKRYKKDLDEPSALAYRFTEDFKPYNPAMEML